MSSMQPPPGRPVLEETSTADLIREALDEAKELMRIEGTLARAEVTKELAQAKKAAIGFGITAAASVLVLCMLAVALVLALGGSALAALVIAVGSLVVGGIAGFAAYSMLPRNPLEHTRQRLHGEVNKLKEHIA